MQALNGMLMCFNCLHGLKISLSTQFVPGKCWTTGMLYCFRSSAFPTPDSMRSWGELIAPPLNITSFSANTYRENRKTYWTKWTQGITKVFRTHHRDNVNICTKFHADPFKRYQRRSQKTTWWHDGKAWVIKVARICTLMTMHAWAKFWANPLNSWDISVWMERVDQYCKNKNLPTTIFKDHFNFVW